MVRWTHCARPVNEGATVAKSLAVHESNDKLASILSAGRLGSEQLHPVILKSLSQFKPTQTLFRVEKAMDETDTSYDAENPDVADPAAAVEPDGDDGGAPTAQAAYNFAQGLKDLVDQLKDDVSKGEHVKGRKKLIALVEDAMSLSEEAMGVGKMVDAEDRKSTRLNSNHVSESRMPSSA